MNGIILSDKVYEAIPKGSYHCTDCDLFDRCMADTKDMGEVCVGMMHLLRENIIFKLKDQ